MVRVRHAKETLMDVKHGEVIWTWDGNQLRVGMDTRGTGPILLLLPALSSISTRSEMRPLQERLADSFTCITVDWPGFGDRPRPYVAWTPEAYRAFLAHLLATVVSPAATIAAGHAAGYVLARAAERPGSAGRLCLVAPTWRGPLPTMMGRHHPAFARIARVVDYPIIGPLFYRLNVNPFVIGKMVSGHVYSDPSFLGGERLREKLAVTRAPGARYSSFRFVSGQLDPMPSRTAFLEMAERVSGPILVIYGAETPPKSKAEMLALASLPNVRAVELPAGKLAVHEEYPDQVAEAVLDFLSDLREVRGATPRA
jgi:pimeloyl-ACP methyl ester carboxylesterase